MGRRRSALLHRQRPLIAAAIAALACSARADPALHVPPPARWHTLETPHFRIHAYDGELPIAYRAAALAEQAHAQLVRRLGWLPSGRIDLTITGASDSANGRATAQPRNEIVAQAAPPEALSTLNDHDDWVAVLVAHELTHVVHLDVVRGLPRAVNFVAGKTLTPNSATPAWLTEGLAVVEESALTPGGRVRNAIFDMYLRVAALNGRLLDLDAVSNVPLAFPYGTTPYLYGASFVQHLHDRFGSARFAEIAHRLGGDLVPYGLNRAARATFGASFDELWEDWRAALVRRAQLVAETVRRQGETRARRLTFHGEGSPGGLVPRFLPDGRVLYLRATSVERAAYVAVDPHSGAATPVLLTTGAAGAAPLPNGRGFVYQQVGYVPLERRVQRAAYAAWDDLWHHDLRTGESWPLTRGLRLHEPDVSPDGALIAATMTDAGANRLVVLPVTGEHPRTIAATGRWDVASAPAWSPDGKRIAYVLARPGGGRDVRLHDVEDGSDRAIETDRAIDADPRFSPDGRWLLFSSDRSGIYDVYAHELATGRTFQVTNVVGGAFQPAVSPDGRTLVFTGFSASGFDLYAMPFEPSAWRRAEPALALRDEPRADDLVAVPPDAGGAPPVEVTATRRYEGWRYLYPRAWDLAVASDPLGLGTTGSFATTVDDPARLHQVDVRVDVPFEAADPSARVDYSYARFWPELRVAASRSAARANDLVLDGRRTSYRQHGVSASGELGLPVLERPDARARLSLGYVWWDFWSADALPPPNPLLGVPHPAPTGPLASAYVRASYSNAKSWNWSVSPQQGRSLSLTVEHGDRAIGSKLASTTVSGDWTEYVTMPWAKLQVLAASARAGASFGERRDSFALGGFEQQDVVRALFQNRQQCCQFLRGYEPGSLVGNRFVAGSVEFRLPLLWIERGYRTFPLYLRRLYGAAFVDAGNAFDGPLRARDVRWGSGAELRLRLTLGYRIDAELFAGLARGLSAGGTTQGYLVSAFPF